MRILPFTYALKQDLRNRDNQGLELGELWYATGTCLVPPAFVGDVLTLPFRMLFFGALVLFRKHFSFKEYWQGRK